MQKEYNKGYPGAGTPVNEKGGHVHDYKPSPLNPNGSGTRYPGRPSKKNEWWEFGINPPPIN